MKNFSLKLIFAIIIFATIMAGSVSIAGVYSKQIEAMSAKNQANSEEVDIYENKTASISVSQSRIHIQEQIDYGDEAIVNIISNDPYVENVRKAVEYYKSVLMLPLPYEEYFPEDGNPIETILYRNADEDGELNRLQEQELIRVKKERLEGYHMAMNEFKRRASEPNFRDTKSEEYLSQLASTLPFYVPPIVVGNACGGNNTLGCYYHSGEIEITPLALSKNDDCLLLSTIVHETRHYNQFENSGPGDYILETLENDANEYMRNNTPCMSN